MRKDERDLLEVLKFELQFLEDGERQGVRRELLGGLNLFSKTLALA